MGKLKGNTLLGAVTTLTALGFMQIGFDNGLMGGIINQAPFQNTFNSPGPVMIGLIVSILEVGAFLGSVFTALVGEHLGRRKSIALGTAIMMIGSILQATAFSRAHLIVARIVAGVGLGINNSTVPVLQAEYSPKASRGLYVCMQLTTLNFGILFVYWMGYAFSFATGDYIWRIPVIIQLIFLAPMLFLVWITDETPRWLVSHDRHDEARDVLYRLRGHNMDDTDIRALLEDIIRTVSVEKSLGAGTWKDLLRNDAIQSQRRLLLACGIQAFQQLGGINAIIYYSGTLFEKSIGFDKKTSSLMAGALQTWFFLASFIPWFLIDRIGRRPLFLSMISLMAAVMVVQTGLIYQVQYETSIAKTAGIGAAAMLFIFQGAFTVGFQATVWVYPTEILPLRLRQMGSSISTATNWIINYMIVQITPISIANLGWRTYIIFAVLNASFVPIIYLFYPETKQMELEDVDRLFAKGGEATHELYAAKGDVDEVETAGKSLA
ncbi:High-affinity glucose transporter [Sphaceloma murrayae]|uniref:High-affinity glucose transporter n=1 Tax=Sphaceloma murrayae TaxID=2082308 RepID=A0A2K1QKC2_9PEZI|nr:High-affinity glucose transporter [Sphaceloma murrayae]